MAAAFASIVSALRRPLACRRRHHRLVTLVALLSTLLVTGAARTDAQEVIEYYATDAVGSIRVVFAPDGTVKARSDYLPFGEEWQSATHGGPLPSQRFTGQQRDAEEGHDNFNARNYHTRLGRMTTTDPVFAGLFEPQRWNRYAYAINNPLAYVDPDGRDPILNFTDSTTVVGKTSGNGAVPFSWALVAGDYTINGIEAIPGWWWYSPSSGAIENITTEWWDANWAEIQASRIDQANSDNGGETNADGDNAVAGSAIPPCPNCIPYTGDPDEHLSTDDFISDLINSGGLRSLFRSGATTIGKGAVKQMVSPAPLRLLHGAETLNKSSLDYWRRRSTQEIVDSLAPGLRNSLKVKANGTVMDGNTRVSILIERGYKVNTLPRELP